MRVGQYVDRASVEFMTIIIAASRAAIVERVEVPSPLRSGGRPARDPRT